MRQRPAAWVLPGLLTRRVKGCVYIHWQWVNCLTYPCYFVGIHSKIPGYKQFVGSGAFAKNGFPVTRSFEASALPQLLNFGYKLILMRIQIAYELCRNSLVKGSIGRVRIVAGA